MTMPRGVRNNNPLNIRLGEKWQGLKARQTDGQFCQFVSMDFGFRAAFRLLNTYYAKYGLICVRDIIRRWAPETENNTAAYINTVCSQVSRCMSKELKDTDGLPPVSTDKVTWCCIVRAMARVECGAKFADSPYVTGDISRGYELAFGHRRN